jgi:uncharacterized circularly permuted ATP-grasp superfamily protein
LPFEPEFAAEHGLALDQADAAADTLLRRALPADDEPWDELREAGGALRKRWRRFAEWVPAPAGGLDIASDLDRRVAQVAQQLQRDGVTHNVFDAQGVAPRPWSLELLPLIIEPAEWEGIAAGVAQRAQLLEAMLADLYGPQTLLHQGLLPPALLHRHPGWLRPPSSVSSSSHSTSRATPKVPGGSWRSARKAPRAWAMCCTTGS